MMRILITGKNGQVGWELQRSLATLGKIIGLDRNGLNLADADSIRTVVREFQPNLIVNAAAYTAVDKAEEEPDLALAVNGSAPGILAEEANRIDAALIHYSTDYVFDGTKQNPYTEDDAQNPLNIYGKTKLAGELAILSSGVPHLIFRTSWIYGTRGKNFFSTILRLMTEREEVRIVNDQVGCPTWSRMVAEVTAQILAHLNRRKVSLPHLLKEMGGIYHLSAGGETSWYGFANAILEQHRSSFASTSRLIPISTDEYLARATRPKYSVLSNSKLGSQFGLQIPNWEDGLKLCCEMSNSEPLKAIIYGTSVGK